MKNAEWKSRLMKSVVAGVWSLVALGGTQASAGASGSAEYVARGRQNSEMETYSNGRTRALVDLGLVRLQWDEYLGNFWPGFVYGGDQCRYLRESRSNGREVREYNKKRGLGAFEKDLAACEEGKRKYDELFGRVKSLAETPLQMTIRPLGDTGTSWVLDFEIQSPILSEYLISGRDTLRIRAPLDWLECDGSPVRLDGASQDHWNRPLDEVIASFQRYLPHDFMKCSFKVNSERVVISDDITPVGSVLPKLEVNVNTPTLTFQNDQTFYMRGARASGGGWVESLFVFSRTRECDPATRERAFQASRRWVSLIQGHGRLLLELASASELSQAEREIAARNALRVKRPEILAQLEAVREGFGELSLIEKLSVSMSIAEAYDYVRVMEVKAARLLDAESRLNLDLTVRNVTSQLTDPGF